MADYIDAAESAKMLRASLKRAFPSVKFSVRTSKYSGGASIRIGWKDGPSTIQVSRIAARFEGADFDGMIDLKTCKKQLLMDEQGNVREVRHGSDFIFTDRDTSPELQGAIIAEIQRRMVKPEHFQPWQWQNECERITWKGLEQYSIPNGQKIEDTARLVVGQYLEGSYA